MRAIGRMYGAASSKIMVGSKARESMFKELAPGYGIVHVAAHALSDDVQPMFSCVVVGRADNDPDDGVLEAREIIDMKLNADLAILSACESGRGGIARGEGLIGLSWAFLVAGCRTTVVSQWSVASKSTSDLMIAFHRNLLRGEQPPSALRHAEMSVKKSAAHSHPFYWAPFVVVGAPQ